MKALILLSLVFVVSSLGNAKKLQRSFSHMEQFYIKNGVGWRCMAKRLVWPVWKIKDLMRTDLRGDPMDLSQGDVPYQGQQYQSSHLRTPFVQPESERPQGNDKGFPRGSKGFLPPPPESQPLIATTSMPPTPPPTTTTTTTKAPCQSLLTPPPTPPPCLNRIVTPAPYDPPCARSEYNRNFRSHNNQHYDRPHLSLQETVNAFQGHNQQAKLNDQPITTTMSEIQMEPARADGNPQWLQDGSAMSSSPRSVPTLLLYKSFFKNDNMGQYGDEMEGSPQNALQRRGRTGRRWKNRHSRRQ